VELLKGVNGYK